MNNRALELFHMIIAEMRPEDGHNDIPALNESMDELEDILRGKNKGHEQPQTPTKADLWVAMDGDESIRIYNAIPTSNEFNEFIGDDVGEFHYSESKSLNLSPGQCKKITVSWEGE